jgi:uncharacterized membrane protein HdeD (DUF308 family)
MIPPSIIAHAFSGMLLVAAGALVFFRYSYKTILLVLMFSLAAGVHAISHAFLEKEYNFIPFKST